MSMLAPAQVPLVAVSEWSSRINPGGGSTGIESCGEASVDVMLHLYRGYSLSTSTVTALSWECVNAKQVTDYPRASTGPGNLVWLANQHGLALQNLGGGNVSAALQSGNYPLLLGLKAAHNLGNPENRTINGHYIVVLRPAGGGSWYVADPNSRAAVSGSATTYPLSNILAAAPFCALYAGPYNGAGGNGGGSGSQGQGQLQGGNAGTSSSAAAYDPNAWGPILGSIPSLFLNAATEPFLATASASKQLLENVPGIAGVCYALDAAEQFPGIVNRWNVTNPVGSAVDSVLETIFGNIGPLFVRGVFVIGGFFLFYWLILALVASAVEEQAGEAMSAAKQFAPEIVAALA